MNLKKEAARLWQTCTFLRNQPNWEWLEGHVQELDELARKLAALAGTSYGQICEEFKIE